MAAPPPQRNQEDLHKINDMKRKIVSLRLDYRILRARLRDCNEVLKARIEADGLYHSLLVTEYEALKEETSGLKRDLAQSRARVRDLEDTNLKMKEEIKNLKAQHSRELQKNADWLKEVMLDQQRLAIKCGEDDEENDPPPSHMMMINTPATAIAEETATANVPSSPSLPATFEE